MKIYNTLTRKKEDFVPFVPQRVSLYVCGVTVYDFCHLGHARVMVFFDLVAHWFRLLGNQVLYVQNITDVDDKIISRASRENRSPEAVAQAFIEALEEDKASLGLMEESLSPRATQWIEAMQEIIASLLQKGAAYLGENGDVYFSVRHFPGYGKLSGKSPEDLLAGSRVEVDPHKRDPLDFVLWKHAKPQEPAWPSPWGPGRPGWHIECSAMAMALLGPTFDIHGGGSDLQFPHHENEIAQSETVTGKPFARYWMHVGLVRLGEEKMAKSTGQVLRVRDVLRRFSSEALRLYFLQTHYRHELKAGLDNISQAQEALLRLYEAAGDMAGLPLDTDSFSPEASSSWRGAFLEAMADDFHTPRALALLFDLARDIFREKAMGSDPSALQKELVTLAQTLGLLREDPRKIRQAGLPAEDIEALVAKRSEARRKRDWAQADAVRQELLQMGVVIEDTPDGTRWRRLSET